MEGIVGIGNETELIFGAGLGIVQSEETAEMVDSPSDCVHHLLGSQQILGILDDAQNGNHQDLLDCVLREVGEVEWRNHTQETDIIDVQISSELLRGHFLDIDLFEIQKLGDFLVR